MKKIYVIGSTLMLIAGIFIFWGSIAEVGAKIKEYISNNPDLPPGLEEEEDEADYIQRREAFINLLRGVDPDRPADPQSRTKAIEVMDHQTKVLKEKFADSPNALTVAWTELGPNPIPNGQTQTTTTAVSGRVTAIEIDPADPNKVYVGTAQGGIFRSLDGGTTWTPIFDSAQTLAIGSLTLDAANSRLWVGTGEANGSADSFAGVGLYRIDDVNVTATLVGPINPVRNYNDANNNPQSVPVFNGRSISKILIAPGDPTTLLVGTAGGVIGLGGNAPLGGTVPPAALRGLYKITNATSAPASAAATRIGVRNGTGIEGCFDTPCTGNRNVNDMTFDLSDSTGNTLILWLNGTNAANDGGVWRSANAMSSSPTFTQTFATPATSTSNGRGMFAVAQLGANPARIYCASGEPSTSGSLCNSAANAGGLRRSTDGGQTWSTELPGGGGFCAGQCFYNIAIDFVPGATSAMDKILLGGNVRSTSCAKQQSTSLDGAATVFANTDVGTHADSHVIKIAASNTSIVYRGDDGGIWKSTDGGATWASLNNTTFRATQFQSIAVHPTDPDFSIGGSQDNGTEKLTTGPIWIRSQAGDGGFTAIDQNATNTTAVTMYHTFFNQLNSQIGYEVSTNAGTSWTSRTCSGTATTNGIACSSAVTTAVNFYAPVVLGPGNPNTIYLGTDRLLRSSTMGTANATVSQAPLVSGVPVSSIGISLLDDNYRIVGLNNGALFYTATGSTTLTNLDPTGAGSVIPDFYVSRLAFDPTNKNTVYIALGNFAGGTAAAQSHVWKVTNLNTTPVLTSINGMGANVLPDVPINGFVVDPSDANHLYAGTDIGVFYSPNGGTTWFPFGTGLPRIAVFDMAIAPGRTLRIATHGRGMWQIPLAAPSIAPLYESDVASRPNGNGSINSDDVVQVRRFLDELDVPGIANGEFQRADSAPFSTRGNGMIDSGDVIQSIRYLNELDALQLSEGPTTPTPVAPPVEKVAGGDGKLSSGKVKEVLSSSEVAPEIRVESASGGAGNDVTINIRVDAVSNEAQYGFALMYDTSVLSFKDFANGTTRSGTFSCNTTATVGRLKCAIGNFPNNKARTSPVIGEINSGDNQILIKVIFTVNAMATPSTKTPLTLNTQSASDEGANSITPAVTPGMLTINAAADVILTGRTLTADGRGIRNVAVTLTDTAGNRRTAMTTSFGYYRFENIEAGQTYLITTEAKHYRFGDATRALSLNADTENINFIALP